MGLENEHYWDMGAVYSYGELIWVSGSGPFVVDCVGCTAMSRRTKFNDNKMIATRGACDPRVA
jgi:hypothetical protein